MKLSYCGVFSECDHTTLVFSGLSCRRWWVLAILYAGSMAFCQDRPEVPVDVVENDENYVENGFVMNDHDVPQDVYFEDV